MHRRHEAGVLLVALTVGLTTQPAAAASGYSSDKTKPDLSAALAAFNYRWRANGKADLSGTVKDVVTLAWNDRVASWVNQNATSAQRFRACRTPSTARRTAAATTSRSPSPTDWANGSARSTSRAA